MSFSHIHNGVHTYITKRNVLHLNISQQNYEKFYDIRTNASIVVNSRLTWYYPYTKCTYY
jgi:hypothetical protein